MQDNRENQKIPQTTFHCREGDQWVDHNSEELFQNKTVVLFALPGAFTPTCSSSHVPRYNELADQFRANGVDAIYCVSVNDAFVMNAWKEDQQADKIMFLPDGNGDFTEAMGQLVNKAELGFGKRSWRYSMLVRNGIIEKMFIEQDIPGDPFQVSDADTMLNHLNPAAKEETPVTLFARPGCGHCLRAKQLLDEKGLRYEEIQLGRDVNHRGLKAVTGRQTVPQIFINGVHIGGADDLEKELG
ncbi:glutathione peroxidase [Motiliproteus sp. MSK22-1]|uniref:glutathione peroxidase n=1 Tax=Motiliproteus sp. MSK22-1 TaxID=1897630 RepID=UPI000976C669|nr:glutathione peroxidase [Motiliproteus sp. MSK22-1]OMH25704.1 glutathione peroxidase [Motiliproteus sp. MSK22-1]